MSKEKETLEHLTALRGGKSYGRLEDCTAEELIQRCRALEQIGLELVVSNNLYRRQLAHYVKSYYCDKCNARVLITQKFSGDLMCKECGTCIAD
jgi:hypothetical protein